MEACQRLISDIEKRELEARKGRILRSEEHVTDPSPFVTPCRLVDRYNYDGKIFTPSYFQVRRTPQDDLFLKKIDKDDVQRCKQSDPSLRKGNIVKYEVSWILSNHRDFKRTLERVGDPELYANTIRVVATLIFSLYSPETLFKFHHGRSHHNQFNKLCKNIQQLKTRSLHEVCYAITHHKINNKEYSFVTQADMDSFLYHYVNSIRYSRTCPRVPCVSYPPPQHKKNAMFDKIHEVVDKMESPKIMEDALDDYTRLLIKLSSESPWDKEQELADRVMSVIDTSCDEDWKSKMKIYVLCMIKFEEWRIKNMRSSVTRPLHHLVYGHDPRILVCTDVWEVIEVAEFRREALGSRFIKRNHLIWAFYELGFGLPCEITKTLNWNIKDEDHPPYHIYLASIKLVKSLREEIIQLQHFIFAVLYLDEDVENLATEMEQRYTAFLRDAALDTLIRPNANADWWVKNVNADGWVKNLHATERC